MVDNSQKAARPDSVVRSKVQLLNANNCLNIDILDAQAKDMTCLCRWGYFAVNQAIKKGL